MAHEGRAVKGTTGSGLTCCVLDWLVFVMCAAPF